MFSPMRRKKEASSVYVKASVYSGADRRMEMVSAEPGRIRSGRLRDKKRTASVPERNPL